MENTPIVENNPRSIRRPWWIRGPVGLAKLLTGVAFSQAALGAVLIVGWTQRLIQRGVLNHWLRQADGRQADPLSRRLPNWIVDEPTASSNQRSFARRWLGSLGANFRQGAAGALNIAVWTAPATSLWLYAWVLGWNISFFKLYEQSALGFVIGISGVLLFVATMLYVPMAHVRQAVTGDWRAFYNIRFNWGIARRVRGRLLVFSVIFAVASGAVLVCRIVPYYVGGDPNLASLSVEQLRQVLNRYYLGVGFLLFPLYAAVWMIASRAYAVAAARHFAAEPDAEFWRPVERDALAGWAVPAPTAASLPAPIRRTGGRLAAWTLTAASCLVWFTVAFEVFVAQFFNYIPGIAWLNHPLVLLPWIRYIPPGLVE